MTVAENRERVDDDRAERYDLEFVADVVSDRAGPIATVSDVVEATSCYASELIVGVDGWYVLVLERESDDVLRTALTRAETIDRSIDENWWNYGNGGRSADQFRQGPSIPRAPRNESSRFERETASRGRTMGRAVSVSVGPERRPRARRCEPVDLTPARAVRRRTSVSTV